MRGQGGRRGTQRVLCTQVLAVLALLVLPVAAHAAITVNDVQVRETNGAVTATFTVTRTTGGLLNGAASVSVQTVDASARAPGDYAPFSGTVVFPSPFLGLGTTQTQDVAVTVRGDTLDEDTESFRLVLSGADIADGEGIGTIADDDPAPAVGVADAPPAAEGAVATFSIVLSAASGRDVSVDFATANGSATAGQDYTARGGTVGIPAGSTQVALAVPVLDDAVDEPSETFELRLSSPLAASIGDGTATATILDTDEPASVSGSAPAAAPGPATPAPAPAAAAPKLPTLGSTTAPPLTGRPHLGISSPRLRRPETVLVTIACPRQLARCAGRLTIFSRPNRRSRVSALRRERRLGRTSFALDSGRSQTFELKLSRIDRRLLIRAGRMNVRAYVVTAEEVRTVNGTLIARTAHSSPRRP